MTDVDSWLMGSGTPWVKFDKPGDTCEGDILEEPTMRQARDFDTQAPATWPDGNPMMEAVITLQTTQRDPEVDDDTGRRLFVVNSTNKRAALRSAIQRSGAKGLAVGGRLWIRYTGDGPAVGRRNGPKLYEVAYKAPEFDPFAGGGEQGGQGGQGGPGPTAAPSSQPYGDPPF